MVKIDKYGYNRFIELDALRGIAVLLVLVSHYTWAYDYHFSILGEHYFHFPYGEFGVQVFFVISGFVIFMTIENTKSIKHFIVSRFSRLYPTYWLAIIITATTIVLFPVPTLGNYTFSDILINFTMLQGFIKIPHIDQVYWSLKIELIFYVIIGSIYYFKQLNKIENYVVLWLLIVSISLVFDFKFEKYIHVLLITDYAPLFIAGIMFYKIKYKKSTFIHHLIIFFSLIIYLFSLKMQILFRNQEEINIIQFIFVFIIYGIFYLLSFFQIKFFKNKVLIFFGYISYPLYLLHNIIGYSIIYRLKEVYDNQFFYVIVTSLITVTLAFLITKIMETPTKIFKYKLYTLIDKKDIR